MSPAASFTTSPGTSCETGDFLRLPVADDGGRDRDHGLELGRRAVGLGFLDEFQPHAQSDHQRHHIPARKSPVANEMLARTASRITSGLSTACQSSLPIPVRWSLASTLGPCSASRARLPRRSIPRDGSRIAQDVRDVHRRRLDHDLRNLDMRSIVPNGGKEVLGKNTRVDTEHAHLVVSPRFRRGLRSQRARADVAGRNRLSAKQRFKIPRLPR